MILGDMDSATDETLTCGAELIVHAYRDGHAPGRERLAELGLESTAVPAVGTSQDVAMLLAHENGAKLIVSVGAHFNLTEFLDKNRAGMSSTFLTRLRIGESLVDAKGVSRLYNPGVRGWQLGLFALAAVAADRDRRPQLAGPGRVLRPPLAEDQGLAEPLMGYSARYHAASLAAVFLALAVGILVGVGFVSDVVSGTAEDLEQSLKSDLSAGAAPRTTSSRPGSRTSSGSGTPSSRRSSRSSCAATGSR